MSTRKDLALNRSSWRTPVVVLIWWRAGLATMFEFVDMVLGVRLAHTVSQVALRRLVGALCIAIGEPMFARSL